MSNAIHAAIFIASAITLSACGDSGTSPADTQPPAASDDPSACDTALYNGIRGSYNGQIQFQSPAWVTDPEFCTWDVSLSVATGSDVVGLCSVSFDFESELISGTTQCDDLVTAGEISGTYGVDEQAPQWPVELTLTTTQDMSTGPIYPTGNDRDNGLWSYVFDERGNANLPNVSETIGYTGVLVQFSDQPKQMDGYTNISIDRKLFD